MPVPYLKREHHLQTMLDSMSVAELQKLAKRIRKLIAIRPVVPIDSNFVKWKNSGPITFTHSNRPGSV